MLRSDSVDGTLRHGLAIDVPLWLEQRLDDVLASAADGQDHFILFRVAVEAALLEIIDELPANIETQLASVGTAFCCHASAIVDAGDERQRETPATFEIIRVVGRGYFDGTGAERGIDHCVSEDGNASRKERMLHEFAV